MGEGSIVLHHNGFHYLFFGHSLRPEPAQTNHPDLLASEAWVIIQPKCNLLEPAAVGLGAQVQGLQDCGFNFQIVGQIRGQQSIYRLLGGTDEAWD